MNLEKMDALINESISAYLGEGVKINYETENYFLYCCLKDIFESDNFKEGKISQELICGIVDLGKKKISPEKRNGLLAVF